MPEFRVGYLGRLAFGRERFPWAQYTFGPYDQWGENQIAEAWKDLAGSQKGIIFTVWDASRLLWFADGKGTGLEDFLHSGRFERWGYFMADGAGIRDGRLPLEQEYVIGKYDRAVFASRWAKDLGSNITGPELDWIPHPINREVFRPVDRMFARSAWGIGDEIVIGCCMTNQARKHWPTVMEAVAGLPGRPYLWIHTDKLLHYWAIEALAIEYGIMDRVLCEDRALTDMELAMRYSACDVTVVISGGEGFCYPVAESLSCGVPAIAGGYGAQAELTPWTVRPTMKVIDTSHNVRRAIYDPANVADRIADVLTDRPTPAECEAQVAHLNMAQLGIVWKKWFRSGLL